MTASIGVLLAILAAATAAFALELVSADAVALGVLLALVATGILTPDEAISGFGSGVVLLLFGLLVMTAALVRTGAVDAVGRVLVGASARRPRRLSVSLMVATAAVSAFISNTAATALFLPVAMGAARATREPPSKLLLPIAFASILTSSVTLVSTSTNLVISDLLRTNGMPALGMFELAPVGLPIAVVGLLYMATLGRRLLRARPGVPAESEVLGGRTYVAEVALLPGSPFAGKTLRESGLGSRLDLSVLRIVRGGEAHLAPDASARLETGDLLVVEGARDDVLRVREVAGIDLKEDRKVPEALLQSDDVALVEAVLLPRSPFIGRTLRGIQFRERYGAHVLAIERQGRTIHRRLSAVRLRLGDTLLVQGLRRDLAAVEAMAGFRVLGTVESKRPATRRALAAVLVFVAALCVSAFGLLPLPIAALLGAFLVFATRCVTPEEAYREVDWKVIVLVGGMLSVGTAMTKTGAAQWIASGVVDLLGTSPTALFTAFFVAAVALTQLMSNQAAAIVVLPVAFRVAATTGVDPRPFAVVVAVAASCSYLTPLEPSCLMVFGPGRYRFSDFARVGGILTLLIYAITMLVVPRVWPL